LPTLIGNANSEFALPVCIAMHCQLELALPDLWSLHWHALPSLIGNAWQCKLQRFSNWHCIALPIRSLHCHAMQTRSLLCKFALPSRSWHCQLEFGNANSEFALPCIANYRFALPNSNWQRKLRDLHCQLCQFALVGDANSN
jgi:hypothetical protein